MKGLPKELRQAFKAQDKRLPQALQQAIAARSETKAHKYSAIRTQCLYGHSHDSRKEADWCLKLQELAKEDKIASLKLQPKFELLVNGKHIADHYPDFYYETWIGNFDAGFWKKHVVEVKGDWDGSRLPVWKLKHKLFQALYPDIEYVVV